MDARRQDVKHLYMLFRQGIGLIFTQELAFFRNEGGFPFRKPLGVIFVALRNFFEALDHTLVQGASTQKLVILSGPGALQLRFLDRTLTASATSRAHSSPVGGGTCSWIANFTSCNQVAFLFPVPLSSRSFLQNPLAS